MKIHLKKMGLFCLYRKERLTVGELTMGKNRWEAFALEYIKHMSVEKAAEAVGISKRQGHRILQKPEVRDYINAALEKIKNEKIADGKEVMEFLTSVMRGELQEEEVLTIGIGEGMTEPVKIKKEIYQKDRIKAADLLGKVYGIYTPTVSMDASVQVVFEDEKNLKD